MHSLFLNRTPWPSSTGTNLWVLEGHLNAGSRPKASKRLNMDLCGQWSSALAVHWKCQRLQVLNVENLLILHCLQHVLARHNLCIYIKTIKVSIKSLFLNPKSIPQNTSKSCLFRMPFINDLETETFYVRSLSFIICIMEVTTSSCQDYGTILQGSVKTLFILYNLFQYLRL